MGLAIRISGQAAKRGLIKRHPSGERLLSDAEAWIRAEHADTVRSLRCGLTPTGEAELVADLHPAADPMILTASDGGAVGASADTSAVGPGYHTFVGRLLERLGSDVGIEWVAGAE